MKVTNIMKKFTVSGNTFQIKDELKKLKPKNVWQRWQFDGDDWILTIQTAQSTKKFEKELKLFTLTNMLNLSVKEWDGTNKGNNYVH